MTRSALLTPLDSQIGEMARPYMLLSSAPQRDEVRATVTPGRCPGLWSVEIAARDRRGLLAMFTGVMRDRRLDISEAAITTQPDGTALQTLVVRSITAPDPQVLEQDLRAALCGTLSAAPVFDAEVLFDHDALRPFTRCDVRAADRMGLLHSLAAAFAVAGADVRSAGVSTDDGVAHDAFDLAATRGGQLNDATERRIVGLIRCGVHEWKAPLAGSRWLTRH